ncbi:conserved hypothetical protein [Ricinus communis]|uniref:Uncharacterized protein n=1 Tax=Ricinus communis TaxID=3988 RepID=B9T0M5_RICCO|nr:conserved hypothetical protein [Ricinus communis]
MGTSCLLQRQATTGFSLKVAKSAITWRGDCRWKKKKGRREKLMMVKKKVKK